MLCDKTSDGKSGNLHYYNTGATELVFRASSMGATCDVFQPGGSTVFGTLGDPSWITAKHEQDYQLTLTNCSTMFTRDSGTFYKDENINLRQTRPLDGTSLRAGPSPLRTAPMCLLSPQATASASRCPPAL